MTRPRSVGLRAGEIVLVQPCVDRVAAQVELTAISARWSFVVFDELVVLVEVKSTRMGQLGRMGGSRLAVDVARCIGKPYNQVRCTDKLLAERHPAFGEIPIDRPRIAIIATL